MNIHQIIFTLHTTASIIIDIPRDINNLYPCDEAIIKFSSEYNNYILDIDCIREQIESLYNQLVDAIHNKNQLHASIKQDIGYLWNEAMQNKPGLTYTKLENIDCWVGLQNLLWATPGSCNPILSTWFYNNLAGSIIIEITPSYPWHSIDPEPHEAYIPYEEWIKTYQPLLTRTIEHDIAIAWKDQAKTILDIIEKNVACSQIHRSK